MKVRLDCWDGVKNSPIEKEISSFAECVMLIDLLDGKLHTLLSLEKDYILMIGGGNKLFVVVKQYPDGESETLQNIGQADGEVELCIGGQYGTYDRQLIVSREDAVAAAENFYSGSDKNMLTWGS